MNDCEFDENDVFDSDSSLIEFTNVKSDSSEYQTNHWADDLVGPQESPKVFGNNQESTFDVDKYSHLIVRKSIQLSPLIWYQVHLEHMLHEHRNVSNCLQDKINEVIKIHCDKGLDMAQVTCYTRNQLLKILAEAYNLIHLKPKIVNVPLANPALHAAVAVFDLKASILDILHDEKLMSHEICFAWIGYF